MCPAFVAALCPRSDDDSLGTGQCGTAGGSKLGCARRGMRTTLAVRRGHAPTPPAMTHASDVLGRRLTAEAGRSYFIVVDGKDPSGAGRYVLTFEVRRGACARRTPCLLCAALLSLSGTSRRVPCAAVAAGLQPP